MKLSLFGKLLQIKKQNKIAKKVFPIRGKFINVSTGFIA